MQYVLCYIYRCSYQVLTEYLFLFVQVAVHNVGSSLNLMTEHTVSLEDTHTHAHTPAIFTPTEFTKRPREHTDGTNTGTGGTGTGVASSGNKSNHDDYLPVVGNFDLKRKRSKSFSELLLPHFREIVPITVRTPVLHFFFLNFRYFIFIFASITYYNYFLIFDFSFHRFHFCAIFSLIILQFSAFNFSHTLSLFFMILFFRVTKIWDCPRLSLPLPLPLFHRI